MKKVITISLALLYLALSCGLTLELHHCMGRVSDVSFLPSAAEKCGECGMKKGYNECCKDELRFVKLQDAHKLITADYQFNVPVVTTDHHYYNADFNPTILPALINDANHSPPDYSSVSLHKINCVYRI